MKIQAELRALVVHMEPLPLQPQLHRVGSAKRSC